MRGINRATACIAAFIVAFASYSQDELTVRQYSVNEGLSQSTVTTLYIDSSGLLWTGTCNGADRWQGNTIRPVGEGDRAITEGNIIRSLYRVHQNYLMIGTEEGAFLYDLVHGILSKFELVSGKIKDKMLRAYLIQQTLVLFTREGYILLYHFKTQKVCVILSDVTEGKNPVQVHSNHIFWLSDQPAALNWLDVPSGKTGKVHLPEKIRGQELSSLCISEKGRVYIAAEKSVTVFNDLHAKPSCFAMEEIGLSTDGDKRIVFAAEDRQGMIWMGVAASGVFLFDQNFLLKKRYGEFTNTTTQSRTKISHPVCISFDGAGNAFIGTDGSGIIKISPSLQKFSHILPTELFSGQCNDNFISALYKDEDGFLYFGTLNSGLFGYHQRSGNRFYVNRISYSDYEIKRLGFILPYDTSDLLVGTDRGLALCNRNNHSLRDFSSQDSTVYTVACTTHSGKILLGSDSGLFCIERGTIERINTGFINQLSLVAPYGADGFVIAERGDRMYCSESSTNVLLKPVDVPSALLPQKPVYNALIEMNGRFFAGTSFGLIEFDSRMVFKKRYTQSDGLPDNHIYSMVKGKNGRIWITTNKGLSCFNGRRPVFYTFGVKDGLQSYEFNTGAMTVAGDGQIVAGGVNGINAFYEDSIRLNDNVPLIELTGMTVQDKKVIAYKGKEEVVFNYRENNLSFTVTATEYTRSEDNAVLVFLKGIDKTWHRPDEQSVVRYHFLPPGNYELMAMACNSDRRWSDPVQLIRFRIMPPFWKQPWFVVALWMISLVLLMIVFYFVYLFNLKKKIRALKQLKEIEQVRIRISREIHDDIGAGLTQIAIITEQLAGESETEWQRTTEKIKKINALTRELIQNMSEIVWMTNPVYDSLESLLVYLRVTINRMTEETGLDLSVTFPDDLPEIMINSAARRKIIQMIKEAVHNTIKHSGASWLEVRVEINGDMIRIYISDNGCGLSNPEVTRGNGLRNMQQNAAETGMTFRAVNTGNGTRIEFSGTLSKITTNM